MAEDLGERTESATPKRREEARGSGQVARSADLTAAVLLITAMTALAFTLLPMLGAFKRMLEGMLGPGVVAERFDPQSSWTDVANAGGIALRHAGPVLLAVWLAAGLAYLAQIGWLFAPKALAPKLTKLNPVNGLKRIFGISGVMKTVLDSLKVAAVVAIAVVTIMQYLEEIVALVHLTPLQAAAAIGWMLLDLAARILALLLVLGIADFIYQKWKHSRDLRMTKQQVKEEMKQAEGDPEVKKRRLRVAQQIAMQRINAVVPRADVIVTNPEHISIALQYEAANMRAPKVVAKGADYLALRIRQIAMRHGIPIIERPPLARALYRQVAVGQEIPPQFYQAVAEILAYVYRLGRKAG